MKLNFCDKARRFDPFTGSEDKNKIFDSVVIQGYSKL
jgi:hypothetical protein